MYKMVYGYHILLTKFLNKHLIIDVLVFREIGDIEGDKDHWTLTKSERCQKQTSHIYSSPLLKLYQINMVFFLIGLLDQK